MIHRYKGEIMNRFILSLVSLCLISVQLFSMSEVEKAKIDDWDYNATKAFYEKGKKGIRPMLASAPMVMKRSLGLSVGGAKDANNFYENIKNSYLPKVDSITYEGVFYDHYFKIKDSDECKEIFCPNYKTAKDKNPFTAKDEYWLMIALDSNIQKVDRKKLNIVVVMDISGSMGSAFNRYYYDRRAQTKENSSKMDIANRSIVSMIDHLKSDDELSVVLFDNQAYLAKPFREIKSTNIDAIKRHILDIKPRGGTNWSAGYKKALEEFEKLSSFKKDPTIYENRIIFITDAMPNRGELSKEGLLGLAKRASKDGIYTTFIGVGVDFNNDLVEAISKTRGANYYSIHSSDEFKKRLDEEFDYMVTPLLFDLNLKFESNGFEIDSVYGSPNAKSASREIFRVDTLFPTPTTDGEAKGGVILLKLKKISDDDRFKFVIDYKDRSGKEHILETQAKYIPETHPSKSIKKAILLSRYVDLMKNFLIDSHKACNDEVLLPYPTIRDLALANPQKRGDFAYIKSWERRSCKLIVPNAYEKLFPVFERYFKTQMQSISDSSLDKELNLIKRLSSTTTHAKTKVDDWIK